MKFSFPLLLFFSLCFMGCSGEEPSDKSDKKIDRPNLDQVVPSANSAPEDDTADLPPRKPSTPEELAKANAILAAVPDEVIADIDGQELYKAYCATCHGFKGDLNVNQATDLTKSRLGIEERVAQVYHGRGLMTPFKGLLTDEQIVTVTKYIEVLRK